MLDEIFRWRVAYSMVLAVAVYVGIAYLVPFKTMLQFLNTLTLSVAVAVVFSYAPVWISTLWTTRSLSGPEWLSLGIGATWTAEVGQRIWSIAWRGLRQPEWMTQSPAIPFMIALTLIGGVMHITAPGAVDGVVPRQNWIWLGAAVGVAVFSFFMTTWAADGFM